MLYDIYFHNDFDGRASAAVMLAFLRGRGDDIEHYVPVKYDIIPKWMDEQFLAKHNLFKGKHNPAIIVDFPYHPGTTFWFDHHLSPFRKEGWEKKFKADRFRRYNDTYRSACHLAYDSLKKDFAWKPPAHLEELVKWLDIIDGANYKSAKQTIEMKEPAIQANNFIELDADNLKATIKTIRFLSERSLDDFVRQPEAKKVIKHLGTGTKIALGFYKKKIKIAGGVMIADLSGTHFGELAHYGPYYLHPHMVYAVRYHGFPNRKNLFHINVSVNPWRRKANKKHIGKLLKGYGGGGHHDVGGVEITGKQNALKAVNEIVDFLNKK